MSVAGGSGLADTLRRLEDARREVGIDLRRLTAPGVDEAAFEQVTVRTGLSLPEEAKDWFRWQNGPADADGPLQVGPSLTPRWYFASLEGAIRDYEEGRRLSERLASDRGFDEHWPADLFPIATGGGTLVVHCGVDPVRAPVDVVDAWTDQPGDAWLFDSIAEMVELITRACRTGALVTVPDAPTQLTFTRYPVPDEIAHPGFW